MIHFKQLTLLITTLNKTAILKIYNDIMEGLGAGKCTVLSSLGLSTVFDTKDHTICVRRLNYLYILLMVLYSNGLNYF